MRTLDRNYTLKEFRSLPTVNVDPNERNVLVEAGWIKLDGLPICDTVLIDKVSLVTPYRFAFITVFTQNKMSDWN